MAFGFKSPYARLMEMYGSLPDEDKAKFRDEIQNIDKAEDEREIDKIEEDRADNPETADEKREEVNEESEQIGKDIDNAEEMASRDIATSTTTDESGMAGESISSPENEVAPAQNATQEQLNTAPSIDYEAMQKSIDGFNARLDALESRWNDIIANLAGTTETNVGISGYGKNSLDSEEKDDKMSTIIKNLGGYA